MRSLSKTQHITLAKRAGVTVDGIVRVRGFDATVAGRGVVFASREPVAVIEHRDGTVRRHAIPPAPHGAPFVALLAAPMIARVVARLLSPSPAGRNP